MPGGRRNGPGDGREGGFTLLELALTLLIVSILLAFAVPRLPSLGRTDLEASAERLAATMTWLADEASLRGRVYRLTLDLDREQWSVAALAPFADRGPNQDERIDFRVDPSDPLARAISLPDDVVLEAVIDREGERASGTRDVFFLPEGATENVGVRLANEDGETSLVELDAVRGDAVRRPTGGPR